jgi:hypothetical protein
MLDASDELLDLIKASYTTKLHVNSWRGDTLLYSDVPVSAGNLSMDRSLAVPERLTLTVPRLADGINWSPSENDDPLSPYGQLLQVGLGVFVGNTEEILRLGWYVISDVSTDGDAVSVTASGLLQLLDEAKFTGPFEPSGTFTDTVKALAEPALTITVDGALTDRNVPLSMKWDEDRLGALHEVVDAWPAEAFVTEDGYLLIEPAPDPTSDDPVWDVTDDAETGTVVKWSSDGSRDGAYNVVVARGEDANGEQVSAVVLDTAATSSTYYGGPFNPLPVPYFFYSPLLTTVAQCESAANTTLKRLRRAKSKRVVVEMVPNPVLRLGDVVTVTGNEIDGAKGTVESISLPLNPGGGSMSMTVSVLAAD